MFDDADLDAAVEGAIISKYRNAGQTCVCANRLLVQDGVYDAFAEKFAIAVAKLQVGNGLDAGVTQGPMIDMNAVAKVEEHIADALAKGGKLVAGGKRHALGHSFFEPTVITDVTPQMKVAKEETFGPLAPLFRFHSEAEALQMANDTEFGLASYFYARDIGRIFRVSEGLEYGMVAVNTGILSNEAAPFGGVKQSGLGREGSNTASRIIWKSNTCCWAASTSKAPRQCETGWKSSPFLTVATARLMELGQGLRQGNAGLLQTLGQIAPGFLALGRHVRRHQPRRVRRHFLATAQAEAHLVTLHLRLVFGDGFQLLHPACAGGQQGRGHARRLRFQARTPVCTASHHGSGANSSASPYSISAPTACCTSGIAASSALRARRRACSGGKAPRSTRKGIQASTSCGSLVLRAAS